MNEPIKLAIFVTGGGTNCENIIRYFQYNSKVQISIVVSSRSDAYALVRAQRFGVPTTVITRQQLNDQFPNRIINIHPALLPKFGGKGMWGHHVHEAVKAAGETQSGITIHFVNPELDEGEHIAQFSVALDPTDTPEDIADKVHELEMKHYPSVIEQVIKNNIQ